MQKRTKILLAFIWIFICMFPITAYATEDWEDVAPEKIYPYPTALQAENLESQELTINASAIGEKRETWTSLTDLFAVNILTEQSGFTRKQALEAFLNSRMARTNSLFASATIRQTEVDSVAQTASALGLFLNKKEEIYVQPTGDGLLASGVWGYILASVVLVALGVGSFLAATTWHNHKTRKKEN